MTNRSKQIGTAGERATVEALRKLGWPQAERRALRGAKDAGDVTGTPGLVWSVKAGLAAEMASDAQIETWLTEAEAMRVHGQAHTAVLVVKRKGKGAMNAAKWWAVMHLSTVMALTGGTRYLEVPVNTAVRMVLEDACELLLCNGYGTRPGEVTR